MTQQAPLSQALFYLSDEWTDAVVVTDTEGNLVGMITYLDILETLADR